MSPPLAPTVDGPSSLWRGAAFNLASRITTMALGLAILVVVARQGPQVQGAFALFVAIESALLAFGSGPGLLLAREAAQSHGRLAPKRVRSILAISAAAGAAASLGLIAASLWASAEPYRWLWVMALAAPLLLLAPTASGLWMGQGRLPAFNAAQVSAPLLVLVLVVASGVAGVTGALAVLVAWTVGKALVGAVAGAVAAYTHPAAATSEAPQTPPAEAVRFMAAIALANLVSLANYRATLFVLERQHGLAEAGVYSVALQLAELLWLLSQAVTVSAFSRIGAPHRPTALAMTRRAVHIGVAAAAAAAPLLLMAAWFVLPSLLGQAYGAAFWPLAVLLPGVVAYAAASALSAYYTHHLGRPRWAAGIAALSLALALGGALLLAPRWGALGAAIATSLAYLVAMGVAFLSFRREAAEMPAADSGGDNRA